MDVVVDVRPQSATFGKWEAFELDDRDHHQLFIPAGFAHGFCALTSNVDFVYKVSSYYDPSAESGIAWNDPDLAIPWPVPHPIVSARDCLLPRLADIRDDLPNSWSTEELASPATQEPELRLG
jgi:dTDP-4-dehydrorhamnose 3,5-epimerase